MPASSKLLRPLHGARVLVTRAEHQAVNLCRLIVEAGGSPVRFPVLEIAEPADPLQLAALKTRLRSYDLAVFISPNAVECTLRALPEGLPGSLQLASVGQASSEALRAAGYSVQLAPEERYDSEALLALPELAVMEGRRVVIFRGDGGRPLLGETLRQRGAVVDYVEVYRRVRPDTDSGALVRHWHERVDLVTVTSVWILDNLHEMLGAAGQARLRATPLLVVSHRLRQRACALGIQRVISAPRAADQAIVATACDWWAARSAE